MTFTKSSINSEPFEILISNNFLLKAGESVYPMTKSEKYTITPSWLKMDFRGSVTFHFLFKLISFINHKMKTDSWLEFTVHMFNL